jgi:DUF1680 family protein
VHRDPDLESYLDDLIAVIARAQEPDGYLYTIRTINPDKVPEASGPKRWSHLYESHELYIAGHMYEAAVAHFQVTGKRSLLDVAIKNADLIDKTFGPDRIHDVPGHEEIEIGLVKLYRVTGNERYLKLARFFVDERGHNCGRKLYGENRQDHLPVVQQTEPVGHAVRAGYLYAGMTDIAAITGEASYVTALDRIWNTLVGSKLYLTAGMGSSRGGEAFGKPYDLPNDIAYNETCAAIANALWNHRMFLLKGDVKYIDVLERIIYNGFLAGVSLSGDKFFYVNPLSADGKTPFNQGQPERQPWFGCACCPVNVVRFLPSIPGYMYAVRDNTIYVNLFAQSKATIEVSGRKVRIEQRTNYPWDGEVTIVVQPEKPGELRLAIREPAYARPDAGPLPSDLYTYLDTHESSVPPVMLETNRAGFFGMDEVTRHDGYTFVKGFFDRERQLHFTIPMPVRRVVAHAKVEANENRVALERGPIVYCVEGVDHDGTVDLILPDSAELTPEHRDELLGGVTVLRGRAFQVTRNAQGRSAARITPFTAVPYYAWNHRGVGPMTVWIPRKPLN